MIAYFTLPWTKFKLLWCWYGNHKIKLPVRERYEEEEERYAYRNLYNSLVDSQGDDVPEEDKGKCVAVALVPSDDDNCLGNSQYHSDSEGEKLDSENEKSDSEDEKKKAEALQSFYQEWDQEWGPDIADMDEDFFPVDDGPVVYNPDVMEVGMQFEDKIQFKKHLRTYPVIKKFQYILKPCDNRRIRVKCRYHKSEGCKFEIFASNTKGEKTFTVRSMNLEHTCVGDPFSRNKSANAEFVAQYLFKKLKTGGFLQHPWDVADEFYTSHNTSLLYHVAWKPRTMCLEKMHGRYEDSYKMVPSFVNMVASTNPGSASNYSVGRADNCFESMMIAFHAPIHGWKNGCIKVVGVDACHLTGKLGGVLMAATGLDAQNQVVPLAIQVEKGLIEAVSALFPGSPHRYCFRHMFKNLKTHYKGSKIHNLIWNAAKAYKFTHWKFHMDALVLENAAAAQYIMTEDPTQWSRAFFDPSSCCEHMNNNFSESFNNMIKKLRDKPICTLGLMYGQLIMDLWYRRKQLSLNWKNGELVPEAMKLIEKMKECTGQFRISGVVYGQSYQVTSIHNSVFQVDLINKTCSRVQCYCSPYYTVDAYKATYATQMQLLRGREDLEEPQEPFVKPPIDKRKPGRADTKRKLGHDEHVSEKRQRTCKRCNQICHNRRTCAGGEVVSNPKGRRPRTMVDGGTQETTHPDPAECSSSRRRRGIGSRGGRGRGSASTSAAASTSASTSQNAPSTSSAPA
ncbi:uncharacterized protein LOC113350895 [Papaver somniferum]|uniref:uncharacterized protein LOC113350895 n=1 Tax=Papaver somniferum TaxID=3469 RepID=UPI000E703463|nr:uncharacterized protein LOC113350895 [Papaver somniferum]